MLRHVGLKRTYSQNVKLASLLGLTAGFVNAAGFLGFAVLTTNVTGHAALFAERIAMQDWKTARIIALWMLLFLCGAFISSIIISKTERSRRTSFVIPICIEILILLIIGFYGNSYKHILHANEIFAGSLLFAMGMQNSLVSIISGSVVRTTHLTGTFTDLGIELAHILDKGRNDYAVIRARIKLRMIIIFVFMGGALCGAWIFSAIAFYAFFIPAFILLGTMLYDLFTVRIRRYFDKLNHRITNN